MAFLLHHEGAQVAGRSAYVEGYVALLGEREVLVAERDQLDRSEARRSRHAETLLCRELHLAPTAGSSTAATGGKEHGLRAAPRTICHLHIAAHGCAVLVHHIAAGKAVGL